MSIQQQLSVLVLTPFDDEREMYAEYLRATGFHVRARQDAVEALRTISAAPPDIVVMRLRQLRGISGIDVVRRIKESPSTRHVPVVIITTSMLPADQQAAHDAQCDSYLLLPLAPDKLVDEIHKLLRTTPGAVEGPSH